MNINNKSEKPKKKYILITPAKNEEFYLPTVADSIINQSVLPEIWIIIDDGSTDRTPEIIKNLKDKYNWIHSVKMPEGMRDLTFGVSRVYRSGFEYCRNYFLNNNKDYYFYGVIDADTCIESNYFSNLIEKFFEDSSLGIASGMIIDPLTGLNERPDYDFEPMGTGRIIRKECYDEIGGYPPEPFADSITNIKAKLRGWKIAQFHDIKATHLRKTNSAEGEWKGQMMYGRYAHYFNKHPLLVFLTIGKLSLKKPFYTGLAFMIGYMSAVLKRDDIIKDTEIREYYRNDRLKEYMCKRN